MSDDMVKNLGPLGPLAGTWEGEEGLDISYIHEQEVKTPFREKIVLEPFGPVGNGPQILYALRYSATAWKKETGDAFHEELGYWLWDAGNEQIMRCFMVPRGVTIIAGGTIKEGSKKFTLKAVDGSDTYGVLNNLFLSITHRTVAYTLDLEVIDGNTFRYEEDTELYIPVKRDVFHHRDSNKLTKIA
ncbi:MAG: hypothetical protein BECKG1743D_GA0114223_103981 [Candidatus Kentron sp. G]|nr:MAG: hypothetical protein BECKG1743F_GA0114225_105961 [Candidatus Kentron sp. G]VFN02789.1 MAG: hypothetical protein BECKG1743D_GA0114223_103981 [Candidatus Kentron sp. G]VFN03229.1 MAG: hypothetical protein BECKG1743E_GA0114224_105921 [Candidatus Kentron sp. G]